jgi:hypothetical protein
MASINRMTSKIRLGLPSEGMDDVMQLELSNFQPLAANEAIEEVPIFVARSSLRSRSSKKGIRGLLRS